MPSGIQTTYLSLKFDDIGAPPEVNDALSHLAHFLREGQAVIDEKTAKASRLARFFFRHFESRQPSLPPEQRHCRQRLWKKLTQIPFENSLRETRLQSLLQVTAPIVKSQWHEVDQATHRILNFMTPGKKLYLQMNEKLERAYRIFAIAAIHLPYLKDELSEKTQANLSEMGQKIEPFLNQKFDDEKTALFALNLGEIFKKFSNPCRENAEELVRLRKCDEEDEKEFFLTKAQEVKSKLINKHLCFLLELTTKSFANSLQEERMRKALESYFIKKLLPSSSKPSKNYEEWLRTFIPFFIDKGHLAKLFHHSSEALLALLSHDKTHQSVDEWVLRSLFPLYFSPNNHFSEEGKQFIVDWLQKGASSTLVTPDKYPVSEEDFHTHRQEIEHIQSLMGSVLKNYAAPLLQSVTSTLHGIFDQEKQLVAELRLYLATLLPKTAGKTEEIFEVILPLFFSNHFPLLWNDFTQLLTEGVQDKKLRFYFKKWFFEVLTPNLFRNTKELSSANKHLILAVFKGLERFLAHFKEAVAHSSSEFQHADFFHSDCVLLEKKIISYMNQKAEKEKFPLIVPNNLDEQVMRHNMRVEIARLLTLCFPKDVEGYPSSRHLLIVLLASFGEKISERVFSTETILIVIGKILYDDFSLNLFKRETPSDLEIPVDATFNKNLGKIFDETAQHLIKIGSEKQGLIAKVVHSVIIEAVMHFFKEKLAKLLYDKLYTLFMSKITFTPFVFLEQLLFTRKKGKRVPTMAIFFNKDNPKVKEIHSKIGELIHSNTIYHALNRKIKAVQLEHPDRLWPKLLIDSERLEQVCANLGEVAYFLLNHPLLLKVLFGYLLGSVKKELEGSSHVTPAK